MTMLSNQRVIAFARMTKESRCYMIDILEAMKRVECLSMLDSQFNESPLANTIPFHMFFDEEQRTNALRKVKETAS